APDPLPAALLGWFVLVAVWLTWVPFALRPLPGTPELGLPDDPVDVVGNLLLLAPVAVVLALGFRRRGRRAPVLRAAVAAEALGLVLEVGQIYFAGRVVSPYDVALNAVGAAAAAWLAPRAAGRGGPAPVQAAGALPGFAGVVSPVASSSTRL